MPQPVYLICGVSGAGKTWVCKQVQDKFHYIVHDNHYHDHVDVVHRATQVSPRPIVTECPFGERLLRDEMEKRGIKVIPYFVIESPEIVQKRYQEREKKPLPKAALTRATTIRERAHEWRSPQGTSADIALMLRRLLP